MNLADLFATQQSAQSQGRPVFGDLLMQAAMRGNHPMGGPQDNWNVMKPGEGRADFLREYPVPEGWMPPGTNYNPPPLPGPLPPEFKFAPRFYVPRNKELKPRGFET